MLNSSEITVIFFVMTEKLSREKIMGADTSADAKTTFQTLRTGSSNFEDRKLNPELHYLSVCLASAFRNTLPAEEIFNLAQQYGEMRRQFAIDHEELKTGERAKLINGEVIRKLQESGRGMIVTTFHFGPYRYVPMELGYMGCIPQIVVRDYIAKEQTATFMELARCVEQSTGQKIELEILVAENIRSMLRGIKQLKRGGTMLFYIDGNTGSGGFSGGEANSAKFDLLSMPIRMRTGVAYLSQKTQVPIVLAFAYHDENGEKIIEFDDPIEPPARNSNEERIDYTIRIFRRFEEHLKRYPAQWEVWAQIFRFWVNMPPPVAQREQIEEFRRQVKQLIADQSETVRLHADFLRNFCMNTDVPGESFILDAVEKRVLRGSSTAAHIMMMAFTGVSLQELIKSSDCNEATLVDEIVRLHMTGLIGFEGIDPTNTVTE